MLIFDKSKIKNNFNKAWSSYDQNATLQKIVAKNLYNLSKPEIASATTILDLGCGTGFVAEAILNDFPDKNIFGLDIAYLLLKSNPFATNKINADIENLPFKNNNFDLGISSLSLQWMNDLEKTIRQSLETLKNNRNFYFSIIVDGSLNELKVASEKCDIKLSINNFITISNLEKILLRLNLKYQIKIEEIILKYSDIYDLLKSIKSIGAGYSANKNQLKKSDFQKINNFYLKNFNLNNKVGTTWRVCYVSIN